MNTRKNNIYFAIATIGFTILLYFAASGLISALNHDEYDTSYYLYQIGLFTIALATIVIYKPKERENGLIRLGVVFGTVCMAVSFLSISFSLRSFMAVAFNYYAIPLGLAFGISWGRLLANHPRRDFYLSLLQIPPILCSLHLLQLEGFRADTCFIIFLFFPFITLFRRKSLTTIFVLLYSIICIAAAKRSILIAYALCLIVYILFYYRFTQTASKKTLRRLLFAAIIIAGVVWAFRTSFIDITYALDRFDDIENTGGSGRDILYDNILNGFFSSGAINFLFGHGYQAVIQDFTNGAHNDFLEIMYDYGFLALILYVVFVIRYLKIIPRRLKICDYEGAFTMIICAVVLLVLGLLNCIITSTIYELLLLMSIGTSIGMIQIKEEQIKEI